MWRAIDGETQAKIHVSESMATNRRVSGSADLGKIWEAGYSRRSARAVFQKN
jgi:hypothetical protein